MLIPPQAENEVVAENEAGGDHQIEDDEVEDEGRQQCQKRLSRYTKTNDAKKRRCS